MARSQLSVVVSLRRGAADAVRRLLAHRPPFNVEQLRGLDRVEVFLTAEEVVVVLESEHGADAMTALRGWEEHIVGTPRLGEHVYSWARPDDEDDLFFLPTPGPGDSDGGDIF